MDTKQIFNNLDRYSNILSLGDVVENIHSKHRGVVVDIEEGVNGLIGLDIDGRNFKTFHVNTDLIRLEDETV